MCLTLLLDIRLLSILIYKVCFDAVIVIEYTVNFYVLTRSSFFTTASFKIIVTTFNLVDCSAYLLYQQNWNIKWFLRFQI